MSYSDVPGLYELPGTPETCFSALDHVRIHAPERFWAKRDSLQGLCIRLLYSTYHDAARLAEDPTASITLDGETPVARHYEDFESQRIPAAYHSIDLLIATSSRCWRDVQMKFEVAHLGLLFGVDNPLDELCEWATEAKKRLEKLADPLPKSPVDLDRGLRVFKIIENIAPACATWMGLGIEELMEDHTPEELTADLKRLISVVRDYVADADSPGT